MRRLYSLHAGGGLATEPGFPVSIGPVGGLCYPIVKKGPAHATVAFEQWREGLEDYEYLVLLRDLVTRLEKKEDKSGPHRYLLRDARRWLSVPESIARPYHDYDRSLRDPVSLAHVLRARKSIAELIEKLSLGLNVTGAQPCPRTNAVGRVIEVTDLTHTDTIGRPGDGSCKPQLH